MIGAIIGDGIYVVTSMGASSLGPAQLVAWLVAGILAALIALAFVQCAAIHSEVGGSYTYASTAFGPFVGFLAGWTLYIGEWLAVSAFPKAFFNYFHSLTGASSSTSFAVQVSLIGGVTLVNFVGVRVGARTNDGLAAAKLIPLVLFAMLGLVFLALHFGTASDHVQPFAPIGWSNFGKAVLPIFWAYAGFELAVLPAGEVRSAARTLPRGLIIGVSVATIIYLLVSLAAVIVLPWQTLADSSHPLASGMAALFDSFGLRPGAGFAPDEPGRAHLNRWRVPRLYAWPCSAELCACRGRLLPECLRKAARAISHAVRRPGVSGRVRDRLQHAP